ncbi:MAG TPA: DUF5615 family PIN-like protein [Bacteroidota bacterium]
MTFVVDESVDKQIVDDLRTANHTILFVAENSPGSTDDEVLTLSRKRNAVLLTADKDFGELVFRQQRTNAGVVLIRLAGISAERKAKLVTNAIFQHEHEIVGSFAVISAHTVRIRKRHSQSPYDR